MVPPLKQRTGLLHPVLVSITGCYWYHLVQAVINSTLYPWLEAKETQIAKLPMWKRVGVPILTQHALSNYKVGTKLVRSWLLKAASCKMLFGKNAGIGIIFYTGNTGKERKKEELGCSILWNSTWLLGTAFFIFVPEEWKLLGHHQFGGSILRSASAMALVPVALPSFIPWQFGPGQCEPHVAVGEFIRKNFSQKSMAPSSRVTWSDFSEGQCGKFP